MLKIQRQLLLAATSIVFLGLGCSHAPVGQSDSIVVDRSNPDRTVVQLNGNWACAPKADAKDDAKVCTLTGNEARNPGSFTQDESAADRYFEAHAINSRY